MTEFDAGRVVRAAETIDNAVRNMEGHLCEYRQFMQQQTQQLDAALVWPKTPGRWSVRVTVRFEDGGEVSCDLIDVDPAKVQPRVGALVSKLGVLNDGPAETEIP